MNNKHYDIICTNQFKKDYKLASPSPLPLFLLVKYLSLCYNFIEIFKASVLGREDI